MVKVYELRDWKPPSGLMESFASGREVGEALDGTGKSIMSYFAKLGVPAEKAAEAARRFLGELTDLLSRGVNPVDAITAARNDVQVVIEDKPASSAAADRQALIDAMAKGEKVHEALSAAMGKGAGSADHAKAFAHALQSALARGLDMASALREAEAGGHAADAAKAGHDAPASAAAGLIAALASGEDISAAAKAATQGMSADQAGAFLGALQAAIAAGGDSIAAIDIAVQTAAQQAALAKGQAVAISAADLLIAALAGGRPTVRAAKPCSRH